MKRGFGQFSSIIRSLSPASTPSGGGGILPTIKRVVAPPARDACQAATVAMNKAKASQAAAQNALNVANKEGASATEAVRASCLKVPPGVPLAVPTPPLSGRVRRTSRKS